MNKHLQILRTLKTGDRIVVPKSTLDLVQHHAIFLGIENGKHIIIENKENHGVRIVTAEIFFSGVGKITRIERFHPKANYSRTDLYHNALSKRGKEYKLVSYNCETFCNEVQHHKKESNQANIGIGLGVLAGLALLVGAFSSSNNNKK